MDILRYDGSFYGLIQALVPWLRCRKIPDIIEKEQARQPGLISSDEQRSPVPITPFPDWCPDPQVFKIPGVTGESWRNSWHAFLSEVPGIEHLVAAYLQLAIEKRSAVDDNLTDDRVRKVHRLGKRVLGEKHRFMGLLRFRQIGENLYYASVQPDTFVLPLLGPFFAKRFADQSWIIHDRKREMAAVYDLQAWTIIPRSAVEIPVDSPEEESAQALWRCFFDSIAVRERLNLALQQKFIPKKYWSDLIEIPGRP